MSVIYLESFGADIATINSYGKAGSVNMAGNCSLGQDIGRWAGSRCLRLFFGNIYGEYGWATWQVDLKSEHPTLFVGYAYRYDGGPLWDQFHLVAADGTELVTLRPDGYFHQHCYAGPGTVDRFTFDRPMFGSRWHYVEVGVHFSATAGWVECRMESVLTGAWYGTGSSRATANANTLNGTAPGARILRLGKYGGGASVSAFAIHDVVVMDDVDSGTPGRPCNDFLGDLPVAWLVPSAPGAHTDFTLAGSSPAATNWQSVDQPASPGDVTYVTSQTVGAEDTYVTSGSPPGANGLYAIQPGVIMRKEGAGKRNAAAIARWAAGPTDQIIGPVIGSGLSSSWGWYGDVSHHRPDGAAWSQTDVAAMQLGERIIS